MGSDPLFRFATQWGTDGRAIFSGHENRVLLPDLGFIWSEIPTPLGICLTYQGDFFFLMIVSLAISWTVSWAISFSSDICRDFVKPLFQLYVLFKYLKSDQKWKRNTSIFYVLNLQFYFSLILKTSCNEHIVLAHPQRALNYQQRVGGCDWSWVPFMLVHWALTENLISSINK